MAIEEGGWDAGGTGGRASWTSERRAGNQLAADDDFEDSAMLAPLAELNDRNVSEGRGRLRAATKRRRAIYAAAIGFVVMLVIYASAGGAASFKWATANNVCEHLRFEATEGGAVGEWARWVKAVSKVYLKNRVLALPDASSHPEEVDAAKAGAAEDNGTNVLQARLRPVTYVGVVGTLSPSVSAQSIRSLLA